MTTLPLLPHHLQSTKPSLTSPSSSKTKTNPFARPKAAHQSSSFTRSALLPSVSPIPPTPDVTSSPTTPRAQVTTPGLGKSRTGCRVLWRGGFEIGPEGYRLDGKLLKPNQSLESRSLRPIIYRRHILRKFDIPLYTLYPDR
jgi:hypothetical protein